MKAKIAVEIKVEFGIHKVGPVKKRFYERFCASSFIKALIFFNIHKKTQILF